MALSMLWPTGAAHCCIPLLGRYAEDGARQLMQGQRRPIPRQIKKR
jgi:hypothetical protein